ncbi:MAG: LrgB family protein [Eubacteriales bacterium]|nr:LrgB family protein [Eubacteriales bacterium]
MREFLQGSIYFGLVLTLIIFYLGHWLQKKTGWVWLNPILFSTVAIIAILIAGKIPYQAYAKGGSMIHMLLTPATVCFAVPLYRQVQLLKRHFRAIMTAIVGGTVACLSLISVICLIFAIEQGISASVMPKSVTTAIAIGIAEENGGIAALAVASVIITGIMGVVLANGIFKLLKIKEPIARGLALGVSAHALGTSKALEMGEVEAAMSSLALIITGMLTVVAAPLVLQLLF